MTRCPHCDHEIRYWDAVQRDRQGQVWHTACAAEADSERRGVIDAARAEDWELEARRHEQRDPQAEYEYHIERKKS